jgi:hypothetical protein
MSWLSPAFSACGCRARGMLATYTVMPCVSRYRTVAFASRRYFATRLGALHGRAAPRIRHARSERVARELDHHDLRSEGRDLVAKCSIISAVVRPPERHDVDNCGIRRRERERKGLLGLPGERIAKEEDTKWPLGGSHALRSDCHRDQRTSTRRGRASARLRRARGHCLDDEQEREEPRGPGDSRHEGGTTPRQYRSAQEQSTPHALATHRLRGHTSA